MLGAVLALAGAPATAPAERDRLLARAGDDVKAGDVLFVVEAGTFGDADAKG